MPPQILRLEACRCVLSDGARRFTLEARNMTVAAGERVAIVGPSGIGKSTLLEMLCLLRAPDQGVQFEFDDGETMLDLLRAWQRHDERMLNGLRSRRLGYAPQRGGYFPALSVDMNALLRGDLAGQERSRTRKMTDMLARDLSLTSRERSARPDRLSAGERQRGVLLQAMVHSPALVIADEPTAALHPTQAEAVLRVMAGRCAAVGAALIISTHDIELARQLGFRLIVARSTASPGMVETTFDGRT